MADPKKIYKPAHAKFRVDYFASHGYFVVDPDGKRVSAFTLSKTMAEQQCDAKQRSADAARKRVPRPCMCCGGTFQSQGIHNRMCDPCRRSASNDQDAPFSFGSIHGRKRA